MGEASRILLAYALGIGLAAVLSGAAVAPQGPDALRAAAAGWGLAAAAGAAGYFVKRRSLTGDVTRFLAWGIGAASLRAAVFVAIVVAVRQTGMQPFRPFVIGVLSVYFGCMAGEIGVWYAISQREQDV